MATAVWTGSLSLGLVVVPVRLYPAIRKKTVRFHELDRSGRRVRHIRVSEPQIEDWEPIARDFAGPWAAPSTPSRPSTPSTASTPSTDETPAPEVAYEEIR